jgi:hypothetical protein
MPRILCVNCKRKLKCERQGVHVVETFGRDSDDPYKLWRADLYKCPDCGFEVVCGFGASNYAEHYEADFPAQLGAIPQDKIFWDKSC